MQYRYGAGGLGSFFCSAAWPPFVFGGPTSSTGSTSTGFGASGSIARNFKRIFLRLEFCFSFELPGGSVGRAFLNRVEVLDKNYLLPY